MAFVLKLIGGFRGRTLFIIVCALAVAALAIAGRDSGENPHQFSQNDCFSCHFTIPQENDEGPLRLTDTISRLCGRCHDMSKEISHQVDMVPTGDIQVPKDMPLDEQGRVTCITCHDIHRPYKNPLTDTRTYFLRRDVSGKNFCLACHTTNESLAKINLASNDPSSAGMAIPPVSHRPAMDKGHGFAQFDVTDTSTELDPLSLACLECHGEPGSPPKTTLGAGIWRHAKEGIGLSHPIGIDYSGATRDFKDLMPLERLDPRIKLFDGKMGCCSCHDPYVPNDGQSLVIGMRGSYQDLCFGCHLK